MINTPNKITVIRIFSVPAFIIAIIYGHRDLALGIFCFSVVTDAIDGFVARYYKKITKLGSFIDPLADKLLMVTSFLFLSFFGDIRIPFWISILVVSREVIMSLGWTLIYLLTNCFSGDALVIQPTILGKLNTVFQMLTILLYLINFKFAYYIALIMIVVMISSTFGYIIRGSRMVNGGKGEEA
ncbi:MAG: CDP-alcohol phosphatidyltransferase family protein [bacterium]|nr:CDP-alcohol phosphatidyltransferase family protein [bacterium]